MVAAKRRGSVKATTATRVSTEAVSFVVVCFLAIFCGSLFDRKSNAGEN